MNPTAAGGLDERASLREYGCRESGRQSGQRRGFLKRGPAERPAATAAQLGTGRLPCSAGSDQSGMALETRSPNHLKHTNTERQHAERKR